MMFQFVIMFMVGGSEPVIWRSTHLYDKAECIQIAESFKLEGPMKVQAVCVKSERVET